MEQLLRRQLVDVPLEVALQRAILDRLGFAPFLRPEEQAQLQATIDASYVFVKNDGPERLRCGRCNAKHAHLTLLCHPRPFRGLTHGLYAYYTSVGERLAASRTEAQARAVAQLAPIFGQLQAARPLAEGHPQLARSLATPEHEQDLCAVLLGTIDPISKATAVKYASLINLRAGRDLVRL